MDKKVVASMLLVLFLCTSGCTAGGRKDSRPAPVSNQSLEEIPADTEIVEGLKTSKAPTGKAVGQQNEDIIELKHWKYGSDRAQPLSEPQPPQEPEPPQPPSMDEVGNDNWEPVSIQLLSQEEIELMMQRLIESGYLKGPAQNEADFQAAIRNFQRDNSLPITGKLDAQTRELLNKK